MALFMFSKSSVMLARALAVYLARGSGGAEGIIGIALGMLLRGLAGRRGIGGKNLAAACHQQQDGGDEFVHAVSFEF
jgi:hypothetical protein